MRFVLIALAATVALAPTAEAQERPPVAQGPKNAPGQAPAFAGQTRAPQSDAPANIAVEEVAAGLPHLWAMEFLPDGRILATAKAGAMHVIGADGTAGPALSGVPEVDARGQGGLLDVALSPDFAEDGRIFVSYAKPRGSGRNGTSVARARVVLDEAGGGALDEVEVIFRQTPAYAGNKHFGSRLAFGPDGALFVTTGERSDTPIRDQAQDTASGLGKVMRINADGSVPGDNPFAGDASAQPEIWSYGHRNLQSAVVTEAGELFTVEHGPRGGDELNKPQPGLNYGWPVITYGINYNGAPIGAGLTQQAGMEQPLYYWDPVIAPSGMAEYTGDLIPEWRGKLLVGGLVARPGAFTPGCEILEAHFRHGLRRPVEDEGDIGHRFLDIVGKAQPCAISSCSFRAKKTTVFPAKSVKSSGGRLETCASLSGGMVMRGRSRIMVLTSICRISVSFRPRSSPVPGLRRVILLTSVPSMVTGVERVTVGASGLVLAGAVSLVMAKCPR